MWAGRQTQRNALKAQCYWENWISCRQSEKSMHFYQFHCPRSLVCKLDSRNGIFIRLLATNKSDEWLPKKAQQMWKRHLSFKIWIYFLMCKLSFWAIGHNSSAFLFSNPVPSGYKFWTLLKQPRCCCFLYCHITHNFKLCNLFYFSPAPPGH